MKFPYLKFPPLSPTLKWISRPLIPIIIIGPTGSWEGHGLIDSGADRCLFNVEIAKQIGIDPLESSTEDFSGIEGGKISAKISKVRLKIIGIDQEIELNVGFVDSLGVSVILGEDGFFDKFRIKFEKDHGMVEITPVRK